jgi:hypothetical protein
MGYCGGFGYALWVTAADLVKCYGHCGGFGYALWATAGNEAVQYKSVLISALCAIAQDLVMRYGP